MVTLSLIIILNDLMSKNNNKKNIINKNIKRKIFSIALKYKYLAINKLKVQKKDKMLFRSKVNK